MTDTSREATLERVSCIWYLVQFYRKNAEDKNKDFRALIDSGSEVNAIHLVYATKLGLHAMKIDVVAKKIDGSHLDSFGIVIANCLVKNKFEMAQFFQKTFLLANISLVLILGMLFLTISKANMRFAEWKLVWRTYTVAKFLLITRKVKIIDKKKFEAAALNVNNETVVAYVVALAEPTTMPIHLSYQAQVAVLTSEETGILAKYSNFSNVFSTASAVELPEYTRINNHFINLLDDKQLPYGPIYSLRLVELEILKTYIKANLASSFSKLSKSPTAPLILFVQKKDGNLRPCVDYWGLNNLTIKNRYLLPLIGKLLDCLGCAKCFTWLDLINAYHRMRIRNDDEWRTAFRMRYGDFKF